MATSPVHSYVCKLDQTCKNHKGRGEKVHCNKRFSGEFLSNVAAHNKWRLKCGRFESLFLRLSYAAIFNSRRMSR